MASLAPPPVSGRLSAPPPRSTIPAARGAANGVDVHVATLAVHAAHTSPALWPVRVSAAYTFGLVASDKVLGRALGLTRSTLSRWRNYAMMPVSECAVILYQLGLRGLDASPVLALLTRAYERGRAEHDRRAGLTREVRA